ncbi:hypothetical protein NL53_13000 [Vibrio variabilis]|uniref:C-type lysozyme inhibitor domain-containing protein n=1 Tax=Vibrio variabilis TaxID=990271 RepID=A0ABR4Y971_9VIBR|nr:MliC family protein [Vibrio variabilis]KHA60013.1 hypothetical protein NL53_13000 [Vibrio variabilis]
MMKKGRFIVMMGVALIGCSQSASQSDNSFQGDWILYQCDAGKAFEVGYLPEQEKAWLKVEQQEFPLIQVPSGSGTKYILDDGTAATANPIVLHTKGTNARLEFARTIYKNCQFDE